MRDACGIGRAGDADMGRFVNILHRAALGSLVCDRPGWSYVVVTPDVTGSFVTINGDDGWLFHVNLAPSETPEDFTRQRCVETIRRAAGVDDLDVEVISVKSWNMGAELSTAFRDRRVLLTGDAAHRTTLDGGVGMNTGLHSAHNLAWKVGAGVAGWAGLEYVQNGYPGGRAPHLWVQRDDVRCTTLDAFGGGLCCSRDARERRGARPPSTPRRRATCRSTC